MNPDRVGKDGKLFLSFENKGEGTVLTDQFFTLPLCILKPIPLNVATKGLYVMLLNPTGGILGGDNLYTKISLGKNTHVCFTTNSATKVYKSAGAPAKSTVTIHVNDGATLEYLPEHLIPYPRSSFHQSLAVMLKGDSNAILYDAFATGRIARGERWLFKELYSDITVLHEKNMLFADRVALENTLAFPNDYEGIMEGKNYCAAILLASKTPLDWDKAALTLHEKLRALNVSGGASPLAQDGCFARFLSSTAEELNETARTLIERSRDILRIPPHAMRK